MAAKTSDKFIPWYFVLFFAVQTALFGWFAYIAHKSHTGVVIDEAYKKGLRYNQVIAQADAQEKLGWRMDIDAKRGADGNAAVAVRLKDRDGKTISGARVKLWLIRPVQDGMDQRLMLQAAGNGLYTGTAALPAPGLWELRAEAEKDGHRFQVSRRAEL